jgi:hypothetical protein
MRCGGNSDLWIVRWTPNSGNACIFRIAGPASFFGRPRLGREPQAFACRRPPPASPASPAPPAPPAPPPNRSWLNTHGETARQRRRLESPHRPRLATEPALRIRGCRSDNRHGFLFSNLLGNYLSGPAFRGASKEHRQERRACRKSFASYPLHKTTRHHMESTPTALNVPSCSAVSSLCVRPLQALDPGDPIGRCSSPQLATWPFPPMVGFAIPPPGLCQAV